MTNTTVHLFTDGGARGNPGPAAMGGVLFDSETKKVLDEFGTYLGSTTNNQAEYQALIEGLKRAQKLGAEKVVCHLDSQLVKEQMAGHYKVKNADLGQLFLKAKELAQTFHHISYTHIPREQNKHADALVNRALDAELGS